MDHKNDYGLYSAMSDRRAKFRDSFQLGHQNSPSNKAKQLATLERHIAKEPAPKIRISIQ